MGTEDRDTDNSVVEEEETPVEQDHPVIRDILKEGFSYQFFQAIRLIQSLNPDSPKIGHQGPAEKECIRIHPSAMLGFHASDMAGIRKIISPSDTEQFEIETTFLSLLGSQSPLPVHYTEQVLQDDSDENLIKPFLDLFHHRLGSLFYRTWEKYRYPMQFDPDGEDWYSKRLLSFVGVGSDVVPADLHIPPVRLLAFSGLFTQVPRSASGLEGILNEYFPDINAKIEGCSAQWVTIEEGEQNRLGMANCTLDSDFIVGGSVYDRSCTFDLSIGPLSLEEFETFLPQGSRTPELRELVDIFNCDCLDYFVEIWIKEEEIPQLDLASDSARLGWTTWLGDPPKGNQNVRFLMKGWLHGRR